MVLHRVSNCGYFHSENTFTASSKFFLTSYVFIIFLIFYFIFLHCIRIFLLYSYLFIRYFLYLTVYKYKFLPGAPIYMHVFSLCMQYDKLTL